MKVQTYFIDNNAYRSLLFTKKKYTSFIKTLNNKTDKIAFSSKKVFQFMDKFMHWLFLFWIWYPTIIYLCMFACCITFLCNIDNLFSQHPFLCVIRNHLRRKETWWITFVYLSVHRMLINAGMKDFEWKLIAYFMVDHHIQMK